ncbi:MAG TPA: SDR family NAD(P)-dependent oxidoreductase [Mycobacteriales bacterium]|nr:SDR family NAD(P)-dependent oxidoreductase [Mycobacteriales bacterium]
MPSVLVTGAARGIGRATVVRLVRSAWDVYAGVRSEGDGEALRSDLGDRVHPVRLDITSAEDIAALDAHLPDDLNAVVNNAGFVQGGPVEGIRIEDLRQQFEVNVVGQIAVTQAALPRLRASRGRVVFVSSVSGRIATPLTGAYSASKFALEALADAARMELHSWGIRVVLVEPAQTDTDMWRTADSTAAAEAAKLTPEHAELYRRHMEGFRSKAIPMSQRLAKPAGDVAATIERALTAANPKARYVVGVAPAVQTRLAGAVPTPIRDAMLSRFSGIPR